MFKEKLTPLNKLLIAGNVFFLLLAVAAALYETPRHEREDVLNALMSIDRRENLPEGYFVRTNIQEAISAELGRSVKVDWAGIEWGRVSAMIRTHATTTEGKRYVVQLLIEPEDDQSAIVTRSEVTDVSDQTTKKGL